MTDDLDVTNFGELERQYSKIKRPEPSIGYIYNPSSYWSWRHFAFFFVVLDLMMLAFGLFMLIMRLGVA